MACLLFRSDLSNTLSLKVLSRPRPFPSTTGHDRPDTESKVKQRQDPALRCLVAVICGSA